MGNKCRFAERVVSTAQRLANVASSRKNPAAWSCCLWWRRGAQQRKNVQIATASWRKNMYPRTLFGRGSTFFRACTACMMLVSHVD